MGNKQHENVKKQQDSGKIIEVLFKISEAVTNTHNLDELFKVIHENLNEILNVDNFYIALHHEENDSITFPFQVGEDDEIPKEIINFSKTPSSTGKVIKNKKPMIFYEKDIIQLADQFKQKPIGGRVPKIWLGAPLIINDSVKGAIVIQNHESTTALGKKDLDLLNSISQHIALAIERKESDEKLTEQRKILEKILESSPVGIALVQNRNFKWVNNKMVKMFGYDSKSDLENKSAQMLYPDIEDFKIIGEKIYNSFIKTGAVDFEIDLVKKDKTIFPANLRLNSGDLSDPMAWTIATVTDISQRKLAQKETYEKERLQGVLEMAGAVCHEINQPLQAILGYSELGLMDSNSENSNDKYINSIKSQAARIGKITRKLSNITHYRTVDYPGNTKIFDIWNEDKNPEQ